MCSINVNLYLDDMGDIFAIEAAVTDNINAGIVSSKGQSILFCDTQFAKVLYYVLCLCNDLILRIFSSLPCLKRYEHHTAVRDRPFFVVIITLVVH